MNVGTETKKTLQTLTIWVILMTGAYFLDAFASIWWLIGGALACWIAAGLSVVIWGEMTGDTDSKTVIAKRLTKVIAVILAVAAILIVMATNKEWIDAALHGAAGIWIPIVAGVLWISAVGFIPRMKAVLRNNEVVRGSFDVTWVLLAMAGAVLTGVSEGETQEAGTPIQFLLGVALILSGLFGILQVKEYNKPDWETPNDTTTPFQRKLYLTAAAVACTMLFVAPVEMPWGYYFVLKIVVFVAACIGISLYGRDLRPLWLLGHSIVALFFFWIFEPNVGRGGWAVIGALTMIFFVLSAMRVINRYFKAGDR